MAIRTAISRCRAAARARNIPATFALAMTRTSPATTNSTAMNPAMIW
jgi:hypothetical protein